MGKNCTQITTGHTAVKYYASCLWRSWCKNNNIFFKKKKLRIDEVSLLQLNTCTGTCIYTHNICVNNLSNLKNEIINVWPFCLAVFWKVLIIKM